MLSTIEPSFVKTFIKNPMFNDIFNYDAYSLSKYDHLNFTKHANKEHICYSIDVPGVAKEDIEITAEGNIINLGWSRKEKQFKYYFTLPKQYDHSSSNAELENGVLTLIFNIRKELEPKKININIK